MTVPRPHTGFGHAIAVPPHSTTRPQVIDQQGVAFGYDARWLPANVKVTPASTSASTTSSTNTTRAPEAELQQAPFALHEPPDVEGLYKLTFAEIVARFAHLEGFEAWLDARKRAAEIRRLELGNARSEGQLIPREFVAKHVFTHLESLHRKLLTDAGRTIASSVASAIRAGESVEHAEKVTRELIGSHLRQAQSDVSLAVRSTAVCRRAASCTTGAGVILTPCTKASELACPRERWRVAVRQGHAAERRPSA